MAEKNYFILVNPSTGKKELSPKIALLRNELDLAGFKYSIFETKPDVDGKQTVQKNFNPIVFTDLLVVGGDGTINEAVNGLAGLNHKIPVSLLSNGTGNDSARSQIGTLDPREQIRLAIWGKVKRLDAGLCNNRVFINGLGIGFDGKVVENMQQGKKRFSGHLSYLYAVVSALANYRGSGIEINIDSEKDFKSIFLMTITKGKSFGGGFLLNPYAIPDDGFLDICIIDRIPVLKRFFYLPTMRNGGHRHLREVRFYKAKKVRLGGSQELVAHLDGEYLGHPPFELSVLPGFLSFRCLPG